MTYFDAKQKIVDEERLIDAKSFRRFVIRMAILILGFCFLVDVLVWCTLARPILYTILTTVAFIVIFFSIFNMIIEDNNSFLGAIKVSKFFFAPYILIILELIILKFIGYLK